MIGRFREIFLSQRGLRLSLITALLVLCGTIENLDYSVAGQVQMRHYRAFLNVFVVFFCTCFFFFFKMYHDKKKDVLSKKRDDLRYWLRPEESERTTFWLKMLCYFCMASIDTVALYLSILASSNVTSPFRALIQQGAIPISMVVSWFLFKRSPAWVHIGAAAMIILGIAGSSWQIFAEKRVMDYDNEEGTTSTGWAFMFLLSTVFMSLGGCMKEWAMMHPTHPLSMNDVNFWVAFNQLLLGVALSPAGFALQQVGTSHRRDVSHLPENFWDGFKCGVLGIGDIQGNGHDGIDSHGHTGTCGYAVIATYLYVFVVCSYNMLMLWVIKQETVVLFFIANAITMPLVALISASDLYSSLGLVRVPFSTWQVFGFVVAVLGTIIYRTVPDSNADFDEGASTDEQGTMSPMGGRLSPRGGNDIPWPDTPKGSRVDSLGGIRGSHDSFPALLHSEDESSDGGLGLGVGFSPTLREPLTGGGRTRSF